MAETAPSFAAELGREHASLLDHLRRLQEGPEPGTADCAGPLVGLLTEAQASLNRHFRFEEQGGYMNQVLAEAPHLYHAAQQLLAEHGRMSDSLDALIATAAAAPPETPVPPSLREQLKQWVVWVYRHEAGENQLVHQACNQDTGTDD
jgi:hypothetical protein